MNRRVLAVVLAVVVQLALVGVAVAPRLSARVAGDEYLLRVAPLDPIDPFRGAYVELSYPDLAERGDDGMWHHETTGDEQGDLFVVLEQRGDVWVGSDLTRERPADGPYLACSDRDWALRCGIESFFLPQDEALAMERAVSDGNALARIRVDRWGNAALLDVTVED